MKKTIIEKHVDTWSEKLAHLFEDPKMDRTFKAISRSFTPAVGNIFRAFRACPLDKVQLVIIGQDPYPKAGVADGLAFSCSTGERQEKSLEIISEAIFREQLHDFEPVDFRVTDLEYLAEQGVLLLNSALTCAVNVPGSHTEYWLWFVKGVLESLQDLNLVYILYGKKAQELQPFIKGKVFKGYHPAYEARGGPKFKTYFGETGLKLQWLPIKDDGLPEDFKYVDIGDYKQIQI